MAFFQIDGANLTNQPSHVAVLYPEPADYPLVGKSRIIVIPETPPTIEVRWGMEGARPAIIAELKTARGSDPIHVITWIGEDLATVNQVTVFMPLVPFAQGPNRTAVDPMTLVLKALEDIAEDPQGASAAQAVTVTESASASVA